MQIGTKKLSTKMCNKKIFIKGGKMRRNDIIGILTNETDNVCTLSTFVSKNEIVNCKYTKNSKVKIEIQAKENIPIFHKMAIKNILERANIVKYGQVIGKAKKNISVGEHVHIHNVDSNRVQGDIIKSN